MIKHDHKTHHFLVTTLNLYISSDRCIKSKLNYSVKILWKQLDWQSVSLDAYYNNDWVSNQSESQIWQYIIIVRITNLRHSSHLYSQDKRFTWFNLNPTNELLIILNWKTMINFYRFIYNQFYYEVNSNHSKSMAQSWSLFVNKFAQKQN